ncbi:MAG: redox-regulated ATPase YchF [Candidatus Aenigmatarchaeota archaeon]
MQIGVVGKTNTGKSSFFKAATLIDVEISNRTFVTIKPNVGIGYVTTKCPHTELKVACNPKNSQCSNGTRLIPVKILDVAGLVPGAHTGKGLGNQFLNDLVPADCLIHVVDASGTTDAEGKPTEGYDPCEDILFLENEIDLWFTDVIRRNIEKIKDKRKAAEVLAGLGIRKEHVEAAIAKTGLQPEQLAKELRLLSKPMIIAANKIDLTAGPTNFEKMKKMFPHMTIIPVCAEAEIALRSAAKNGLIRYVPGASEYEVPDPSKLSKDQACALEFIREKILRKWGSTGVQSCLNAAVFDVLKYMAVYPVENETKWTDKKGNVLPDVYLMPPGSTAKDLAFKIHADIGKGFLYALDARTKRRLGADYQLRQNDVISIVSAAK